MTWTDRFLAPVLVLIYLPLALLWLGCVLIYERIVPPPKFRAPVPGVDIVGRPGIDYPLGQMECDVKHFESCMRCRTEPEHRAWVEHYGRKA